MPKYMYMLCKSRSRLGACFMRVIVAFLIIQVKICLLPRRHNLKQEEEAHTGHKPHATWDWQDTWDTVSLAS